MSNNADALGKLTAEAHRFRSANSLRAWMASLAKAGFGQASCYDECHRIAEYEADGFIVTPDHPCTNCEGPKCTKERGLIISWAHKIQ